MVKIGDKFRIKEGSEQWFYVGADLSHLYEVKEMNIHGTGFYFDLHNGREQSMLYEWDVIDWIKDDNPQITVGSKWQGKNNGAFIAEIVSVNEDWFEYKGNVYQHVNEYNSGIDNWLMYMEPYEETESEIAVKNEPEFINTKTTLKSGRFGNLHITNHNALVKVSVVQMTESKQVRAVIEQLIKVAEFWEGEGK